MIAKPFLPCALAPLALLAACGGEPASNASGNVAAPDNANEIVVPPAINAVEANASNASDEAAGLAVDLAPDELTLVEASGKTHHAGFGVERAVAVKMVSAALGSPIEEAASQDCGEGALGYTTFRDGLSLYFQEGKFVGWDLDGRENGKFTTMNGIGIGSTRAELEKSGSEVQVEDSSIGHEFRIGELSGLLSAPGPGGKVTNLWAGSTCIAR